MQEGNAAGQNTDEKEDRFENELIAGVALGRAGLAACFAYAKALAGESASVTSGWDRLDVLRARDSEIGNAVTIMKAMAEVTLAAAKLRGEFRNIHDITRRTTGGSEAPKGARAGGG